MSMQACISELQNRLATKSWTQDAGRISPLLVEWRGRWNGGTPFLVFPQSTEEVSQAVKICAHHKIPITVQGGNTGLVGGQIPQGEILLSTIRLNKIRQASAKEMSLICEAGVSLLAAQQAASDLGLKFPLSLASEGSCTIGGNLSTNAGGVHVVKYGTAKELVFGIEAVLANGEIFNGLTSLRKDNTGYDLSQVLLGAEGTLGVITAASLKLFEKPKKIVRVMAAVSSPEKALELLGHVRIGDHLSMFEFIPRLGIECVINNIPGQRDPFSTPYPYYVLLDWEFNSTGQSAQFAETVLSQAFEKDLLLDAVIASSEQQASALLALRENLSGAQKPIGATIKHDITVPIDRTAQFIKLANTTMLNLIPDCHPLPFGHFGDGNIHYNVGQPSGIGASAFMAREEEINEIIYDIVDTLAGSISAEHGIGILKKQQLQKRADPVKLRLMKTLKTALDPDGIFNPRLLF